VVTLSACACEVVRLSTADARRRDLSRGNDVVSRETAAPPPSVQSVSARAGGAAENHPISTPPPAVRRFTPVERAA